MKTNMPGVSSMNVRTNPIHLVLALVACLNVPTLHAQQRDILPLPSSGNVTLSLDEYNRLITLAAKPVKKPEGAPLNYAIQHADLKLHVTTDSVLIRIDLQHIFRSIRIMLQRRPN